MHHLQDALEVMKISSWWYQYYVDPLSRPGPLRGCGPATCYSQRREIPTSANSFIRGDGL